ncbi:MCP four helix bundle domain-containing protein [Undibacterium sp. CY7W]|uniref:MCP four helix bundle domain-containing protein n=1 Tax=Undibacterium rugosum TaxID=2762291 RepID=A0A923HZX3_9BURK|nr:methyl-accepting chemotaxis protein [Undibacterium rugosum]MBC3935249.1 MCP four helix bundle domain-containing protein [Undibacterium rugosum]
MNLPQLKIATRLALCFASILIFSFLATALAQWRLQQTADETRQMMQQPLAKERMISDWYRYIQVGVRRTAAIAKSSDSSLLQFFSEDAAATMKGASDMQNKIESLLNTDEEKKLFADISAERKIYTSAREDILAAKERGDTAQANQLIATTFMPAAKRYQALVQNLLEKQREELNRLAGKIEANYQSTKTILSTLSVLAFLCGVLCTWLLARSILRELGGEPAYASAIARRIAQGDLATEVVLQPRDQSSLLYAMKTMRDGLANIVSQVRAGTETIASASDQIAAGNLDLSGRTEAQASALEQTAASMEQLNSTVRQNADNARQANQLAASASDIAAKGGEVVSQVVNTMHGINNSAHKITEIIGVIDGIAFQTNILALNAAVEAARAGDQGRGFAVVATEVRNLAQRSAAAAKEIKVLIGDSVNQVQVGSKLVEQAGSTMQDIVQSVEQVAGIMHDITSASQEQSQGIAQVNQAINQMDDTTQQNAALVEEATTASVSLQDQAQHLAQMVSVFKLDYEKPLTARSARLKKVTTQTAIFATHLPNDTQHKKIANSRFDA